MKEIGYINGKKVWHKMSRQEALQRGIKIVDSRWIDINKGDQEVEEYRSRFVAKKFNQSKKQEEG
jgi:hypothetical protein